MLLKLVNQYYLTILVFAILPCNAKKTNTSNWSDNFGNKRTDYIIGTLHKTEVKIPPPKGFIEGSDFEYIKLMKSIANTSRKNHIGAFIREVEVPALIRNEADLKLKIHGSTFSIKRFDHIDTTPEMLKLEKQAITKQSQQYKEAFEGAKKALMGQIKTKLEILDDKKLLELDEMNFNQKVLPVHDDSEEHFSYSTYQVNKIGLKKIITTQTMTMVVVKKKLIFLVVSGEDDDLEETRRISRWWVRDILDINSSKFD